MKPALLVIDMQNQFFSMNDTTKNSLSDAIEYINAAIELFRAKELPVICIQDVEEENGRVPGKEKFEVPESINLNEGDLRIHKTYGNAFNKTPLAEELQKQGVDTVILTGFCAEICVLSTYRGAQDLDLTPILFRGSLASTNPENIGFVERVSDVISYNALEKLLEGV